MAFPLPCITEEITFFLCAAPGVCGSAAHTAAAHRGALLHKDRAAQVRAALSTKSQLVALHRDYQLIPVEALKPYLQLRVKNMLL